MELFLPQIIDVVHSVKSEKIYAYKEKLRETVCIQCRDKEGGNCYLRNDANCSLDRYFSLIVETIQKVDAGKIKQRLLL